MKDGARPLGKGEKVRKIVRSGGGGDRRTRTDLLGLHGGNQGGLMVEYSPEGMSSSTSPN